MYVLNELSYQLYIYFYDAAAVCYDGGDINGYC